MKTLKLNLFSYERAVGVLLFLSFSAFLLTFKTVALAQEQASITVTGKVTSVEGETLPGVGIKVKNSTSSTTTDVNGGYKISVPDGNSTLIFSFIGFATQEVAVNSRTVINVQLQSDTKALEEVVIVGYGTQKKANLTGSVATVQGETLTQRPAPNAANLLQGRVTGLQVTQPSGEPGRDNPTFVIRGRGSFGGGTNTQPLILIDGVAGSYNNLSPDDIENVTVLKDAASSAIYGSRGANGVILVTTKKGKRGQPVFSYRLNVGRHTPTELPDLITNSADYMTMYNAAATRQGIPAATGQYDPLEIAKYRDATDRNQYPNFDNIDYYINSSTVSNHNFSVSGGSEKSTYNLSLGYLDQNAIIRGYKFKRYNGLLNYSTEINKVITIGTSANLTYKDRKEPPFTGEGMALSIYAAGPLYGPFLPDGSGRIASKAYAFEGRNRNPQEYYAMGDQNTKEYNLNGQAYIDVKPLKGLTWSTKVALNYTDEYYKMYQRPYQAFLSQKSATATDYTFNSFGPDILGVTDQYAKVLNPTLYSTLTYNTQFKENHNFNFLAGYEQISFKNQNLRARRTTTVAPVLRDLTGYAGGESLYFSHPRLPGLPGPSEWALTSFFGRVNYDYKGKYLLEGNLRYDGTSKVSPEFRWGTFPSVSAGWVVSQEDFLKDKFNWLTNLKLRASYGVLGNQDVGTYLYQDNLVINNILYPFDNSTAQQGAVNNVFRDQSLRWESTSILDFGLDLDIRRGLLGLTFDWFDKTTYDILATQPIPLSLGLGAPTTNDGKLQNKGIELGLTHQNKIGEISYGANFLASTAKNKVLSIRVPSDAGSNIRKEGLPYDEHYLYVWDGVFQVEDIGNPNVPRHALNPTPKAGDIKMKDLDGDGDVDVNDRQVIDGVYPDLTYSFGLNLGYKRFHFNAFFQGVEGISNRVSGWGIDPFHQGTAPTTKWRDAWTPENRSNTLPAIYIQGYSGIQSYIGSTYYLQDASYLRLKNVMLSYEVPLSVAKKVGANGIGVYVSGDNLFTITKYEGGDPERSSPTGNFAQYPQTRIYNVGLNVKF
ncbi:TonB-dependent receptor [Pedobacter sp. P351]|uniref:SusC/RagA family TonB-linked outer membrane protein n=1 Tax=Pedobacter superstes TaxID=3133441 RepID=UPI0030A73405